MTESAIREKDALLASIAEQSVHAGQAFAQGLEQEAFADERSFLQACLPAEERESLERLSQELHAARMELAGRGRAAREHLATETAKALTTKSVCGRSSAYSWSASSSRNVCSNSGPRCRS